MIAEANTTAHDFKTEPLAIISSALTNTNPTDENKLFNLYKQFNEKNEKSSSCVESIKSTSFSKSEEINIVKKESFNESKQENILSDEAKIILRQAHGNQILINILKLSENAQTPGMITYVNETLFLIRHYINSSPYDEFTEILKAFHDAISYKAKWADYNKNQYLLANKVLSELLNKHNMNLNLVYKYINKIEEIGFDTLPFELVNYDEQCI